MYRILREFYRSSFKGEARTVTELPTAQMLTYPHCGLGWPFARNAVSLMGLFSCRNRGPNKPAWIFPFAGSMAIPAFPKKNKATPFGSLRVKTATSARDKGSDIA